MAQRINEVIKKEGNKWVLYTADGSKKLGEFDSEEEAKERERQIQYFKHKGESEEQAATDIWMTETEMRTICPGCADEMVKASLTQVNLSHLARQVEADGKGNWSALMEFWTHYEPGMFTKYVEVGTAHWGSEDRAKRVCAGLHHAVLGVWPGEKESEAVKETEFWNVSIAPRAIEGETVPTFEGREWDVTIIGAKEPDNPIVKVNGKRYIRSQNGRLYLVDGIKDSVPRWEGVQVFDNHLTDAEFKERGGMRSVLREMIGGLINPRFVDGELPHLDATLRVIDEEAAKKLKAAWDQKLLKTVGLSIDTMTIQGQEAEVGGQSMPTVEGFGDISSTDLVARPAAGGGFNRLIAAQNLQEANEMTPQEIQELVGKAVADALAAAKAKEAEDEEARKKAEAEAAAKTSPVPEAAPPVPAPVPVTDTVAMEAVRKLECAIALRDALDEAKLDTPHRRTVEAQFKGKIFAQADLDSAIKLAKEAQIAVDPTGQVRGTGTAQTQVGMNETDKMAAEFLRLVWRNGAQQIGERQEPFVKERLTEAHAAWIKAGYPSYGYRRMSEWAYDLLGGDPFTDQEAFTRATEATTTSSMTSIIKNALNVMLACDYAKRHRWWDPIVTTEEVDTIDQATLVRVYGMNTLSVVDEGQAYSELAWADEEETASFVKKGNFAGITLEALLSDKLQVVRSIPTRLATSWYNTLSALVSGVFTVNSATGPVLGTTGALFNATAVTSAGGHANLLTAALSFTSYGAARLAMLKQTDQTLGTGQKLLIQPKFILVPVDLEATANQIFNTERLPGSANNDINPYYKQVTPVVVPNWTDANDWALVGDPAEFPAIYMISLRGRQVPELFTAGDEASGAMFTNDTLRYKVRMLSYRFSSTYDCSPIADFRPIHKSNVS